MSSSRERLTVRPLDVRRPNLTAGGGRLKEDDCEFKVFLGGLEAITMIRALCFFGSFGFFREKLNPFSLTKPDLEKNRV